MSGLPSSVLPCQLPHCVSGLLLLAAVLPLPAEETGLVGVLFHEPTLRRPARVEFAAQLNDDTGTSHAGYSRIWLGRIRMPAAGSVRFETEADDGMVLRLNGQQVIGGWASGRRAGDFTAPAGNQPVPLEVLHHQRGGTAHLRLFWSWHGHPRELVPAAAFFHEEADRTRAEAMAAGRELPAEPVDNPEAVRRPVAAPTAWSAGDWLFLDERNILSVDHLRRVQGRPRSHSEPVVDGAVDGNFQPYVSVVRDGVTGRWRMWYNVPREPGNSAESSLALIESADGVHWDRPHRILDTPPIQFGASVIDEGPDFADPSQRYKAGWHHDNGLQVATSPDGVKWSLRAPGPVLRHSHDIDAIDWDPLRQRYMAFVSSAEKLEPWWREARRIPCMSTSSDLVHWQQPWPVVRPEPNSAREQGETQFYCMAGTIARGGLLISLVKVLRDDLNAEPGMTAQQLGDSRSHAGIGYTVLAWSQDGEHWQRETEPFLDRNPVPGTWDRAHAWGDEQVLHGDLLHIYYGGYRLGHKSDRFTTRQIGLATMKRDRYAGYEADDTTTGTLRTAIRKWLGDSLTVNADARGELRVALCDSTGGFVEGFSFADCQPLKGDSAAHPVTWKGNVASLGGRDLQLVFSLRDSTVYSFTVNSLRQAAERAVGSPGDGGGNRPVCSGNEPSGGALLSPVSP